MTPIPLVAPEPFFPPPKRRGPLLPWAIAGVAVLVAIAAVIWGVTRGGSGTTGGKFAVHGTLKLVGDHLAIGGQPCFGTSGYDDIAVGASVVIYDAAGKQLVIGALGGGTSNQPGSLGVCTFTFDISGVPAGVGPYSIEVTHRGKVPFDQSTASDVELTLGS